MKNAFCFRYNILQCLRKVQNDKLSRQYCKRKLNCLGVWKAQNFATLVRWWLRNVFMVLWYKVPSVMTFSRIIKRFNIHKGGKLEVLIPSCEGLNWGHTSLPPLWMVNLLMISLTKINFGFMVMKCNGLSEILSLVWSLTDKEIMQ